MSARRIGAAVCASLALTLGSAGVAFAYGTDSSKAPSPNQDPCAAGLLVVRGTNGDDTGSKFDLRNTTGHYTICTFGGNDTIYAGPGGATIYAGPGNDTIYGGPGDDYIEGQGGDDVIYDDDIHGGGGSDTLLGQTGADTIYANDGIADTLIDGGTDTNMCTVDTGLAVIDNVKNCVIK